MLLENTPCNGFCWVTPKTGVGLTGAFFALFSTLILHRSHFLLYQEVHQVEPPMRRELLISVWQSRTSRDYSPSCGCFYGNLNIRGNSHVRNGKYYPLEWSLRWYQRLEPLNVQRSLPWIIELPNPPIIFNIRLKNELFRKGLFISIYMNYW